MGFYKLNSFGLADFLNIIVRIPINNTKQKPLILLQACVFVALCQVLTWYLEYSRLFSKMKGKFYQFLWL
jgi:hypothetical protein